MLKFRLFEFDVGGRRYLILPTLNSGQMKAIHERLSGKGLVTRRRGQASAGTRGPIHVNHSGVCWSASDPSDAIVPVIPDLLSMPKETISVESLASQYFRVGVYGRQTLVRLSTRVESALWRALRSRGECGLAPDERALVTFIVGHSSGCEMLADFPTSSGRPVMVGKKQYYRGHLTPGDVDVTLSDASRRRTRCSYIPKDGVLRFDSFELPGREELLHLFEDFGDWCSYAPS